MSAQHASQSLVGNCRSCGGEVPLTLAGPLPTCRYCNSTEPLTPELGARLATLRARLDERSAQQRHLTGKWVDAVTSVQGTSLVIWITMWVLFGGPALGLGLDHDVPFLEFFAGEAGNNDLAANWWMLLSVASGLPLSIFFFALSLYWLRSMGLAALPLAPAQAGAPPRCRACAAALPDGTSLRRCNYCSTDNLVVGEHYQKRELDLDRALRRTSQGFGRSLAGRVAIAEKAAMFGAMLPVGLLLFVPVFGMVLQVTVPVLWVLPPALWVLALLGVLLASTRKLPNVEPIDCLTLESDVTVGGTPMKVSAQLLLGASGTTRRVLSFFGTNHRSLELMGHVDHSGKRWKHSLWDVRASGAPLEQARLAHLESAELRQPGSTMKDGVKTEQVRLIAEDGSYRLWLADTATPGAPPTWTLTRRKQSPLIMTA
jgi:hypothetical protein